MIGTMIVSSCRVCIFALQGKCSLFPKLLFVLLQHLCINTLILSGGCMGGSVRGIYFLCLKIHWDHPAAVGYASFRPL